jgi:hypothetical protein
MRKIGIKNFRKFVSESEEPDPGDYELLRKAGVIGSSHASEFEERFRPALEDLENALGEIDNIFQRAYDIIEESTGAPVDETIEVLYNSSFIIEGVRDTYNSLFSSLEEIDES